jgi:microtubule-associated protein-like 6
VFRGHSSYVSGLRFSSDGNYLISIGGHDKSIFQWKYINDNVSKEEIESIADEEEGLNIDEKPDSGEKEKMKEARGDKGEAGIFDSSEVEKADQFLAVKPFLQEVINSIPTGFKQSMNSVFEIDVNL